MALSRGQQKFDRLTITLVPTADEHSFKNVPSTFNTVNRTYAWRQLAEINYMLVPRKISSNEIKVDIFLNAIKGKKHHGISIQKKVQAFVQEKIQSDWRGLKLESIAKAAAAIPPVESFNRGTIEEMLGVGLD
ncbi:MAG: hypothetical protein ACKVRP_03455 [Bacteroidota bacterium]